MLVDIHSELKTYIPTRPEHVHRATNRLSCRGTRPNQHLNWIRTSAPFTHLRSLATFARELKRAHCSRRWPVLSAAITVAAAAAAARLPLALTTIAAAPASIVVAAAATMALLPTRRGRGRPGYLHVQRRRAVPDLHYHAMPCHASRQHNILSFKKQCLGNNKRGGRRTSMAGISFPQTSSSLIADETGNGRRSTAGRELLAKRLAAQQRP